MEIALLRAADCYNTIESKMAAILDSSLLYVAFCVVHPIEPVRQ